MPPIKNTEIYKRIENLNKIHDQNFQEKDAGVFPSSGTQDERLQYFLKYSGDIQFSTNSQGVFTEISPSVESVTGYGESEVLGETGDDSKASQKDENHKPWGRESLVTEPSERMLFENIIHKKDRQKSVRAINKAIKTNGLYEIEYKIVTKSGKTKWLCEKGLVLENRYGKRYLKGLISDIHSQKRSEEINRIFFNISSVVNTNRNLNDLYESIHHSLGEIIDTTNFYIAIHNIGKDTLSFPYYVDTVDTDLDSIQSRTHILESGSLTGMVLKGKKPILIRKDQMLKFTRDTGIELLGTMAEVWLGVPLKIQDEVIGAMAVQSYTDPKCYDERDVDILMAVSEQIAIAIERKKTEESLNIEKAHLEQLFYSAPEAIVMADTDFKIIRINNEFTKLFGYHADEAVGKYLDDLVASKDTFQEAISYSKSLLTGKKIAFESQRQKKDGTLINVSCIGAPIIVNSDLIAIYSIYRDITDQKRDSHILSTLYRISRAVNSTKSLDELFGIIHQSLSTILDTKNFFIALYDKKKAKISFPYCIDEKDSEYPIIQETNPGSLTAQVIAQKKPLFYTEDKIKKRFKRKGCKLIGSMPKIWLGVPLKIKGKVIGAVVLQSYSDPSLYSKKDITLIESISDQIAIAIDSKQSEQALLESERRYRTLFDGAGDAIFVHTPDHKFLDVNRVACERYGYSKEEFMEMTPEDITLKGFSKRMSKRIKEIQAKGYSLSESIHTRRNGSRISAELSSRIIEFDKKPMVLSIARDITQRKKEEKDKREMQIQLQHAQKMEAIGMLAGGVAHDLNNILSGIVSYPDLLLLQMPPGSPLRNSIQTIKKSGEKAAAIVQDLLTLARRGVSVREVVNLNNIITEYLKSPEYEILKGYTSEIDVKTDLDPALSNILGSPIHLFKTIMNLASNAIEAMPGKGKLTISTQNKDIGKSQTQYGKAKKGKYATLIVSDTGTGISSQDRERIFEPFYTKKVMGRSGTGIGMAVVWGTVKDHKGYIDIQSSEGKGTVFTLYFPVTQKKLDEDDITYSIDDYKGRGESIVIVDDVPEQREIAGEIMKILGYKAKSFSSGEEAVDYMKHHSADLAIIDMIMEPGIDGLETCKRILKLHPDQRIIIVSGFSETKRIKAFRSISTGTYIKKPYLIKTIGPAIRKELDK